MIYVYNCYRAAHLSVVAAALHLGHLSPKAGIKEILALDYFDMMQAEEMGVPLLMGRDGAENPVYILGLGRGSEVFARLVDSVAEELGVSPDCKLVDCLGDINFLIRLGGLLARFRPVRRWGRLLAARGICRRLNSLHHLVLQAREGQV